jgi:hypothetical protein
MLRCAGWTLTSNQSSRVDGREDRCFTIENLKEHVRSRRAELYVAAPTILHRYLVAGAPSHGGSRKGSYEAWDDVVRGACIWAGLDDPCAGIQRIRADADEDLAVLRVFLTLWREAFGDEEHTVREAIDGTRDRPDLTNAIADLGRCDATRLDAHKIGLALRSRRGRIVGGLRLTQATISDRRGVARWRVECVEA